MTCRDQDWSVLNCRTRSACVDLAELQAYNDRIFPSCSGVSLSSAVMQQDMSCSNDQPDGGGDAKHVRSTATLS